MFKKSILLLTAFLSLFSISACKKVNKTTTTKPEETSIIPTSTRELTPEEKMDKFIDTMIEQTPEDVPAWNQENFKGKWNYIDGVFLKSIIDKYNITNDEKYMDFVVNYVNYYIDEKGEFVNRKNSEYSGYTSSELDSICESRILFDLLDYTNDSRYETAITRTYNELFRMKKCEGTNNFNHKSQYDNQIWLDGQYMYAPFITRYAIKYEDYTIFDMLKEQYEYIRNHMFDTTKKLYYHAMDTTKKIFWSDPETGLSKSFWLRGMGWYFALLADVLGYMDEILDQEIESVTACYTSLKNIYEEGITGILQYLDTKANMFYQVVDRKGEGALVSYDKYLQYLNPNYTEDTYIENYLESSGSLLIAYSLLKVYNDNHERNKIGKDIFNGVYNHSFVNNSLNDICITAGLGPFYNKYRDSSFEYYLAERVGSNDAKGVGPFIMAYLAL